jgi:glycine cleavage system aminomethyltransferase T
VSAGGVAVGVVTSGNYSPVLDHGIALAHSTRRSTRSNRRDRRGRIARLRRRGDAVHLKLTGVAM